jgi:hypothetical protein
VQRAYRAEANGGCAVGFFVYRLSGTSGSDGEAGGVA